MRLLRHRALRMFSTSPPAQTPPVAEKRSFNAVAMKTTVVQVSSTSSRMQKSTGPVRKSVKALNARPVQEPVEVCSDGRHDNPRVSFRPFSLRNVAVSACESASRALSGVDKLSEGKAVVRSS